jgi:CRP-like cAMP-binding protein
VLPYFELKKYYKNEYIYKARQQPLAVYLILKGEVMLEVRMPGSPTKDILAAPTKAQHLFSMQTEILGSKNYFGEEEVLLKVPRALSAVCRSV